MREVLLANLGEEKKGKKYRGMDEEMKGTDHKMSRGVMELWR